MKKNDFVHEFDEPSALEINRARLNHLDSLGLPLYGKQVIDVGAGVGNLANFFVEKKCDVVCIDGREANVDVLKRRLSKFKAHVLDVNSETLTKFGDFDVVFCYGLLYHTSKPDYVLQNLASVCSDLLILETCVCDALYPLVRFVHDPSTLNQALDGIGCRPAPGFVVETLKLAGLRNVYVPKTPPKHKEFEFAYENDRSIYKNGHLIRQIFIASRTPMINANLKEISSSGDFFERNAISKLKTPLISFLASKIYKSEKILPVNEWILDIAGDPKPDREIYKKIWKELVFRGNAEKGLSIKWNGIKLKLSLDTETAYSIYVNGEYEPNELSFLKSVLKKGMTFLDVGANVGIYSLIAAKAVGRKGKVIAVEPSTREYNQLSQNCKINNFKNLKTVKIALSDKVGQADLEIASLPHSGHNTLKNFIYSTTKQEKKERVKLETLDRLVSRLGLQSLDVIKIDVEGAEYEVLKEGRQTLSKFRPIIIFEISNQSVQNGDPKKLFQLLRLNTYQYFTFNSSGLKSLDVKTLNGGNVIAIPPKTKKSIVSALNQKYLKGTYVDHSFHQKTNSTFFTIEFLQKHFDLKVVFDNSWKMNKNPKVNSLKSPQYLFYMQVLPHISELELIQEKTNIVWFPMYDAVSTSMSDEYLKDLSEIKMKVVCFSKTLYRKLKNFGFDCQYFQYYPKPADLGGFTFNYEEKNVYFWYRKDPINWEIVKKLLENTRVDKVIIKNDPDPGTNPLVINEEDIKRYRVKIIDGHLDRYEYLNLLKETNIFIAPRIVEGIGQSVVESLTRGQCVVAPNTPTMNEYIKHEINGILYDFKKPEGVDLTNYDEIGMRARFEAIKSYRKWNSDKEKLLSFITS